MSRHGLRRRCVNPILAALCLCLGAVPAARADDDAPPAAQGVAEEPPHPLLVRWAQQLGQRERQVAARMAALVQLENLFLASAARDDDADGAGEYAPLAELLAPAKAGDHGYSPPVWAQSVELDADGVAHVDGYLLRVDLPAGDDAAATTDLSEKHFVVVAWPETYGVSGRATLRMDDDAALLAADLPRNSGKDGAPAHVTPGSPADGAGSADGVAGGATSGDAFVPLAQLPPVPVPDATVRGVAWRDAASVKTAFDAALADVARICGAEFGETRPTFAIATRAETAEVLGDEARRGLLGDVPGEQVAAFAESLAETMYAKYDEAADRVLVVPGNVEAFAFVSRSPLLLGADALRSVLTHELTHALDVRRFPLTELRSTTRDPEARRALNAVIEGHAEMVAAHAALGAGEGGVRAHELVTRSMTETPGDEGPRGAAVLRPLAAAFAFPYLQGHSFCEAVFEAGGAPVLERALSEPPTRVRQIEAPRRWLDGVPDPRPQLDATLAPLLALAPDAGSQPPESMTATSLRAAYADIDGQRLDAVLAKFEAGRTAGAAAERGARVFSAAVLRFEDAASATAFVGLLRESADGRRRAAAARPGMRITLDDVDPAGGSLAGFVLRQSSEASKRDARIRIAVAGRDVLELTLLGMGDVAAVQVEAALDAAAKSGAPPK